MRFAHNLLNYLTLRKTEYVNILQYLLIDCCETSFSIPPGTFSSRETMEVRKRCATTNPHATKPTSAPGSVQHQRLSSCVGEKRHWCRRVNWCSFSGFIKIVTCRSSESGAYTRIALQRDRSPSMTSLTEISTASTTITSSVRMRTHL